MSRARWLFVALALLAVAGAVAARGRRERTWRAPSFAFVDQSGRTVTGAGLRGRPWIADFIFTSCSSACPFLTARMILLQRRLTGADVRFVSFSVDPEHDTPAVLRSYAEKWHGDATRWHLLATTAGPLGEVATGLHALAAQSMHSNRFVLVDGDGVVRGTYDSTDDEAMRRLATDAAALAPKPEALASAPRHEAPASAPRHEARAIAPRDGAALYATLGCGGCHAAGAVARPLPGLYGTRVALDDGRTVVADEAYLRESIVDPLAKIVAGAPPTMPSYAGVLDAQSLDALVAYIASLTPPSRRTERTTTRT